MWPSTHFRLLSAFAKLVSLLASLAETSHSYRKRASKPARVQGTAQRPLVRVTVGPRGWVSLHQPGAAGPRGHWAPCHAGESPEPREIWFNCQVSAVGAGSEHE